MRILRGWLIAAIAIAGVYALVHYVWMRPKPIDVRVSRVARGKVEETVSSTKAGAIRSRFASDISAESAGKVVEIHAREGAQVEGGAPLVSLDRRDVDAALAAARSEIVTLSALVDEATARHQDAKRKWTRISDLLHTGTVTQSELDSAQSLMEASAAALAASLARVESQKAAVSRVETAVAKCVISAPFGGVVSDLRVELGEWTIPGQVAVRLLDLDRLYVRAEIDEINLGPLRTDLPARVTLDPYRDRKLSGRITRVAPEVSELQEKNRTVVVEIELAPVPEGVQLKPGTSADVEVILRSREGVLRIPTLALLEGNRVLVADGGKARAVTVQIGLKNWEYTEVASGLSEGDAVIVSLETEAVKEGVGVRITGEE